MWTSEQGGGHSRPAWAMRTVEALALAVVFGFLPELLRARFGDALELHPGWIAVLIVTARYGIGGFFFGLLATAGAAAVGSVTAGTGLETAWSRLSSAPNLMAFGACLILSWVASLQSRRQAELHEQLRAISDRAAGAEATIRRLRDLVERLKARVNRTSASLSFLRDVATRLDGPDPVVAAEGAADLALVRSGACAVAIKVGAGDSQGLLVMRDVGTPGRPEPLELAGADISVPIPAGSKQVGVIALWGVAPSAFDDATAHDLSLIASWCGAALAGISGPVGQAAGRKAEVR